MSRVISALVVIATAFLALPAPTFTTPGTDWRTGDLFIGVGDLAFRDSRGKYLKFGADGGRSEVVLVDKNRGYTEGCAVDPATGFLWTTSGDGNTMSRFDDIRAASGEYALLQTVNVRAFSTAGSQGKGAVGSVAFDANGYLYAGTRDGANKLLKFGPDGVLIDSYALPAGVFAFDLAADQHTVYYTSPRDSIVRRYDLAARAALPDFATLIDGSLYNLRLLPNDLGLLVAGSAGVTRLATSGAFLARYWLTETQFYGLSISPDGRSFWTSNMTGQLLRFDLASEKLTAGPIDSGYPRVRGLCAKDEYLAAIDTCRTIGEDGQETPVKCPAIEICSNGVDDDGDGDADGADLDCQIPGVLHELIPPVTQSLSSTLTGGEK